MNGYDNHLDPPEEQSLRKVSGMSNTWERWYPCEYCEGEGEVLEDTDIEYEDEDGELINRTIFHKIECPHCKGNKGQWHMEVDE